MHIPGTDKGDTTFFPSINPAAYPKTWEEYKSETQCSLYYDMFMSCVGIGGRFKNYYRHASFIHGRDCGVYSKELWFCIRQNFRSSLQQESHFERHVQEQSSNHDYTSLQKKLDQIWKDPHHET